MCGANPVIEGLKREEWGKNSASGLLEICLTLVEELGPWEDYLLCNHEVLDSNSVHTSVPAAWTGDCWDLLAASLSRFRDCPKGLRQRVWQSRILMSSGLRYSVYMCCKQHTPATQTWIGYTQVWKVFQSAVLPPTYCFCSEVLLVYSMAPLIKCEHK